MLGTHLIGFHDLFLSKGVEKQAFPAEHWPVLVLDLGHGKGFPSGLQELHVGPSPLLETEEDGRSGDQGEEVLQSA